MSLFEEATSLTSLLAATRRAARGKKDRPEVARFLMDSEPECLRLRRSLRLPLDHPQAWWPSRPRTFHIRDPKPRTITVAPFSDRVVHHALCDAVAPALASFSIFHSYACWPGKGQHRALFQARRFARGAPWALKCDIAGFFASVPHAPALAVLEKRVPDPELCRRLGRVLAGPWPGAEAPGRGLPIGSLTSQHLANLYLGVLDHWLTDGLGMGRYLRYMDDFIVFGEKDELKALHPRLRSFLQDRLDLTLNEKASRLMPVRDGIPFLGFRVFPTLLRPSPARWRRFRRRHRALEEALLRGEMDEEDLARALESQFAHFAPFSTFKARRNHLKRLAQSLGPSQTWLQPGHPGGLVEERSAERSGRESQQERARQPERQRGLSRRELNADGGERPVRLFRGSDEASSRSGFLDPGVDPTRVPCPPSESPRAPPLAPLARGTEAPRSGGGAPGVAAGPLFRSRR